jgi:hypothetical protein
MRRTTRSEAPWAAQRLAPVSRDTSTHPLSWCSKSFLCPFLHAGPLLDSAYGHGASTVDGVSPSWRRCELDVSVRQIPASPRQHGEPHQGPPIMPRGVRDRERHRRPASSVAQPCAHAALVNIAAVPDRLPVVSTAVTSLWCGSSTAQHRQHGVRRDRRAYGAQQRHRGPRGASIQRDLR